MAAGGIQYRDDALEANRRSGMPYGGLTIMLEDAGEVRIYFKTVDGRKPRSSEMEAKGMAEGWELHVLFLRGLSVLEVYRRSRPITEYEMNRLLGLQADRSHWERVDPKQLPKDAAPTVLGYSMVRNDGVLRANRLDPQTLLIVKTEFDAAMAAMRDADLQELAPQSVRGF